MSQVSRRGFLKGAGTVGLVGAGALLVPNIGIGARRAVAQSSARQGRVMITQTGGVNLHSYIAPESSFLVNAHIIETANRLVVIDTQWTQTFAGEFRAYADSLNKPIDRVVVSHQHPDHWFGANVFGDVPVVTTPGIATGIEALVNPGYIEFVKSLIGAEEVAAELNYPEASLELGEQTIDGIVLDFSVVTNTESPEEVVIRVPEARTLIVQDLLFNNVHYYPAGDTANWITVLEDLLTLAPDYDTVLLGHGLPSSMGEIDGALQYLRLLQTTVTESETAEEAAAAMIAQYPTYAGEQILFLLLPALFPTE